MEKDNILINEMLFNSNILDGVYECCVEPDTVGIANAKDSSKSYFVYETDERGNLEWFVKKNSLSEAITYAREMYTGLKSYYNGIANDSANINKKR